MRPSLSARRFPRPCLLLMLALPCSSVAATSAIDGEGSGVETAAAAGSRVQNAESASFSRTGEETDPDQNEARRETVGFRFSGIPQEAEVEMPLSFQIEAVDDLGDLDPNYVGTVVFDSSDFGAVRPGTTSFSSTDRLPGR